ADGRGLHAASAAEGGVGVSADARPSVVITGMGLVSAAGCDVARAWERLVSGCSAVRPIERFDASRYPSRMAAAVDGGELARFRLSGVWRDRGRIATYAAVAAGQAIAGATPDAPPLDREPRPRPPPPP